MRIVQFPEKNCFREPMVETVEDLRITINDSDWITVAPQEKAKSHRFTQRVNQSGYYFFAVISIVFGVVCALGFSMYWLIRFN